MAAVRAGAILVFLSVFPGSERVSGQRAPCYHCEDYKENHPQTSPYQQIRTHCSYPCECDNREPTCPPDVSIIRDGCGCCPICAGQLGQPCDGTSVCDDRKGLVCRYPYSGAAVGICQATTGLPCMVSNKTYNHGETFQTDCRTQCSCQNGTYACSSLCPNENISPRGACTHPRLVEVPDQCCREWMCDSTEAEHPPVCKQQFTSWSSCSADCGLGISQRVSNLNQNCILRNETRICQLRPCEVGMLSLEQHARHRHIRKGHECKATQRVRGPVRLRFGPCRSKKRYRPKFCGRCDNKVGDGCCAPQLSTTIKVEFICNSLRSHENPEDLLLDLIEPGRDLWWPDDLLAIGKQRTPALESVTAASDNLKIPYFSRERYTPKILPVVSREDMHLLQSKDKLNEPLLGADVLVYEPGYNEKDYRNIDGNVVGIVTLSTSSATSIKTTPTTTTVKSTTEETTTQATTTETTTSKPKKKRKKKPRKAFTSWLEFRDEEYQMDEYEDEDEAHSDRRKRSLREMMGSRNKRSSGSFREGYLEELQSRDDEYEDEDENDEDEDSDEDDDDDDDEEDEEDDEDEDVTKRNRSLKKPVFYAFYRKKRDAEMLQNRKKGYHPKKHDRALPMKQGKTRKRKEKAEKEVSSNSTQRMNRLARITKERHTERMRPEARKRKAKKMKEKAKVGEKALDNKIPEKTRKVASEGGKMERIVLEKDKGMRVSVQLGQHGKNKTLYHTAGKVHKSRTRRQAPPWPEEEEDESEDLTWGDHSVSFSVQWIIKCHCDRDCGLDTTTVPSELNNVGEVILRRVHRTAPP